MYIFNRFIVFFAFPPSDLEQRDTNSQGKIEIKI